MIACICLMISVVSICTSCKSNSVPEDPFYELYNHMVATSFSVASARSALSGDSLTLSACGLPLSLFSRIVSDKFNVGVVFSSALGQKTITAEFKNSTLSDCFNVVSRQLSVNVVKVGNTFFVGELRPEDRGILVRKILGFSNDDLFKAVGGVLSDKGKFSVIGNGIVTATDVESVLVRVGELLDYLSSSDSLVWIVQLAFLTINKEILVEGGLKVTTSGTLSYNVSDSEFKLSDINIDGIINAAMSSSFADVHSCPMLLVREGSSSSWKFGRRVPVPRRSVSDQGTVTTTGYDYIDVGFNVSASLNRSRSGGILSLQIGKSDIDSYVDSSPVTSQNVYEFVADMVPLKPYLLGELSTFKDLNTQSDILNFGKTKGKSSVQVWGQIYPIRAGVRRDFPLKIDKKP